MTVSFKIYALMAALLVNSVCCSPKYDMGGFVPSSMDYLDKMGKNHDQMAIPTQSKSQSQYRSENASVVSRSSDSDASSIPADRNQEPRFGFTGVGTSSGYGVSSYSGGKVDLGGLILGAVLGIGSILIIPKILYLLSGSYGQYARSDEGGFVNSMTKIDDILTHHGIDTTTCMQRAVCTYAKRAAETIRTANDIDDEEKVSSFDRLIDTVTTNQVFRTAMRGTAIQEAIEAGRKGQNCSRAYRQCGFSMESIVRLISSVMSSVNRPDSNPTAPSAN
ncbi:uncharacterized protein LOC130676726 [Microplitis mediator]|uniref:uncharacterized protein LOC130676726 n=1 Tax=Microplitis mediator TaxID=375433 RepID=UPI0025557F0A|nr:uncharacterized protein LOC130676726 [Microplitis mediator]